LISFSLVPPLACKPFQRFHHAKVNQACQDLDHFSSNLTGNAYNFARRHTYERGLRNFKQVYGSFNDIKDSVLNSLNDAYGTARKSLTGSFGGVKNRVTGAVETTAENAKEYYDAGIQKVNNLIEELKQEREKILGA
jgi:predicted RecB family nuclease